MGTRPRRALLLSLLVGGFLIQLSTPGRAAAQTGSASQTTLARQLFRQGIAATREHDWEAARDAFARSYELTPRAMTLLNLAGTQRQLGRLVEAAESYREFLTMARRPPEARHRPMARQAIEAIEASLPSIRVMRRDAEALGTVRVVIDDAELPEAAFGEPFPVDPGEHRLTAERDGYRLLELELSLAEGDSRDVVLDDQAWAPAVPTPEEAARSAGGREAGSRTSSGGSESEESLWASPILWVIVGVIVVGAAVGIGVGVAVSGQGPSVYSGNTTPGAVMLP